MRKVSELRNYVYTLTEGVKEAIPEVLDGMANELMNNVVANAPIKTGAYASSIKRTEVERQNNRYSVLVYTDYKVGEYILGMLLEYGTSPHTIVPVRANFLHWQDEAGNDIFAKEVHHPGTAPYPHWMPALDSMRHGYNAKFRKALRRAWKK